MTTPHTPEEIIAALDACKTTAAVDAVVLAVADRVADMAESPALYVRAIHIRNMAEWKRMAINGEWKT